MPTQPRTLPPSERRDRPSREDRAPINLQGIKSLIIDQDSSVRAALHKALAEWGSEVVEAESGPRGIVELKRTRDAGEAFGLIFIASEMSPIDGFEIAELLRTHPLEFERTILMVGPQNITLEVPRAHNLGIGAYVAKPLSRAAIVDAIATVLGVRIEQKPMAPAPDAAPRRKSRILVAEDDADIALIIRTQIEGPDYEVDVAPNGGVATDLFRMVGYDLILMDLQMPNFDGYWATREIRNWERRNHLKRSPIVAVTAFAHEETPDKSFQAGLDGYLVKPVDKATLLKVISKHLAKPTTKPVA